jgi:hypothetical protein
MAYAPEPDLFIRTGGEQRISNFLLWQLAYTELFFTDTFWPDFSAECSTRPSPPTSTASGVSAAPARNWLKRQTDAENEDYYRCGLAGGAAAGPVLQLFPRVCPGGDAVCRRRRVGARLFGLAEGRPAWPARRRRAVRRPDVHRQAGWSTRCTAWPRC